MNTENKRGDANRTRDLLHPSKNHTPDQSGDSIPQPPDPIHCATKAFHRIERTELGHESPYGPMDACLRSRRFRVRVKVWAYFLSGRIAQSVERGSTWLAKWLEQAYPGIEPRVVPSIFREGHITRRRWGKSTELLVTLFKFTIWRVQSGAKPAWRRGETLDAISKSRVTRP